MSRMRLFAKRTPETVEQITERVRNHWCPSTADDPTFLRFVSKEIKKAKDRGLLIDPSHKPDHPLEG